MGFMFANIGVKLPITFIFPISVQKSTFIPQMSRNKSAFLIFAVKDIFRMVPGFKTAGFCRWGIFV